MAIWRHWGFVSPMKLSPYAYYPGAVLKYFWEAMALAGFESFFIAVFICIIIFLKFVLKLTKFIFNKGAKLKNLSNVFYNNSKRYSLFKFNSRWKLTNMIVKSVFGDRKVKKDLHNLKLQLLVAQVQQSKQLKISFSLELVKLIFWMIKLYKYQIFQLHFSTLKILSANQKHNKLQEICYKWTLTYQVNLKMFL